MPARRRSGFLHPRKWTFFAALAGCVLGVIVVVAPLYLSTRVGGGAQNPGPSPQSPVAVDPQFLPTILTSPNASLDGHYGESIAVQGSTLVVGAPGQELYSGGYLETGIAYVENLKTGASREFGVRGSSEEVGSFGWSVAIDGSYVVIGAPGDGYATGDPYSAGHVYLYNTTTLAEVGSYESPNAQAWYNDSDTKYWTDDFGASVAVSGSLIVVGAPGENASGHLAAGHAYVINARTGAMIMLASPYPEFDAMFGSSVAISGNYVVVGAPDEGLLDIGGAYLYSAVTGDLIESFSSPLQNVGGSFGDSVAISWPTVAVGAPGQSDPSPCPPAIGEGICGAVYLFSTTGGSTNILYSPNPTTFAEFGTSVAIDSSVILVGAPHQTHGAGTLTGEAYLYSRASGALVSSNFSAPEWPAAGDFGSSVALNSTDAFVSAPNERAGGAAQAGHAYIFTKIPLTAAPRYLQYGGFGTSVSVQGGDYALGAPNATVGENAYAGQAFLMRSELGPVVAFNGTEADEEYGTAVAVDPMYFAVGAPGAASGAGQVFVYYTSNGTLHDTLSPGGPGAAFGTSLAISGDLLIVGAPGGGFVDVYNVSSEKLVLNYFSTYSGVGRSVAISGAEFALGISEEDAVVVGTIGTVYTLFYLIYAPSGVTSSFGAAVAVANGEVVIGAPAAPGGGQAYVYSLHSLSLRFTLDDTNATSGAQFGDAVADNGGTIVVGAAGEAPFGVAGAGNVFLYTASTGTILDRYNAPSPTKTLGFGRSVALGSGGKLFVGEDPTNTFSVYAPAAVLFFF